MSETLLWNELGKVHLKMGSFREAVAAYTQAIELEPACGWSYFNLGQVYLEMEDYGQALFVYRKSLAFMTEPADQVRVWNKIGDAYRALKDIENAILAYRKADGLEMGSPATSEPEGGNSARQAATRLARLIGDNRKVANPTGANPNEATLPAEENSETEPEPEKAAATRVETSPVARRPLVVIPDPNEVVEPPKPTRTGDTRPAGRPVAMTTLQDQVGNPKTPSNSTPMIENLEEILAKVNVYENITRVNPSNDRAWDTLGKLYKMLGRYKDAIAATEKAIEIAPDREVYYYYLGLLYAVEQQHDDAVRAFTVVLRKNPDYILAHSALAGVYHRMGLENKANHHIATALPKMNNESAYNRACFYAICGDNELAFEFLRLALMNKDTTIEWIKSDPDLDPIRNDQRFQELISGKDLPVSENMNGNYFTSELEGVRNHLLPILNNSLAR